MKRKALLWFSIPLLVVALFGLFIISPLAPPVVATIVNQLQDDLSIEQLNGTLFGSLEAQGVTFQTDGVSVDIARVQLTHDWQCLLSRRACISSLAVNQPTVAITPTTQPNTSSETAEALTLPLGIKLDALQINQLAIDLGSESITVERIQTHGQAGIESPTEVTLNTLQISKVVINLPASPASEPAESFALNYPGLQLPTLQAPLDISVNNVNIADVTLIQPEQPDQTLALNWAQLSWKDYDLSLQQAQLKHPQLNAQASLTVATRDDYALNVTLSAATEVEQHPQQLELSANGSLSNLNTTLTADGFATATLSGTLNLLDTQLPGSIELSWPQQSLQLEQPVAIKAGHLSLNGDLDGYQYQIDTELEQQPIGLFAVDSTGKLTRDSLIIDKLHSMLFEGTVESSGSVSFSQQLVWRGTTQLTGLNLASAFADAPELINGSLASEITLYGEQIGANVPLAEFNGQLNGVPFDLSGHAAYASQEQVLAAQFTGHQGTNQFSLVGQLVRQRALDALLTLNLSELHTLHSGLQGNLSGTIKMRGALEALVFDAKLTGSNLNVTPELNAALSRQGPVSTDISFVGTTAEHSLTLKVEGLEHHTNVELNGRWRDDQWYGTFEESEVAILTTQWQLQQAFELQVNPQQSTLSIAPHCWLSRRDGQLCVQQLNVQNEQADWQINAQHLPLGLWVHELLPEQVEQANEATLTVRSNGQFRSLDEHTISSEFSVSPGKWPLGPKGKLVLSLDKLSGVTSLTNGQLNANTEFSSSELGNFKINVAGTPLADQADLSGTLHIAKLTVAPLRPLLPGIEVLTGSLSGDVDFSGDPRKPTVQGSLSMENGGIQIKESPVSINNWQQTIEFNGNEASFAGQLYLDQGLAELDGKFAWHDKPWLESRFTGDSLQISHRDIRLMVSPDITTRIEPGSIDLNGKVGVPWARVVIESLPDSAISPSNDVHLRGEPLNQDPMQAINASIEFNIDTEKRGEVRLDAFGLTGNLTGKMVVHTQPALTGYGDLQILKGRFEAYGQNLIIRSGEVQFNGPLDQPFLLVEAIRDPDVTADNVVAGVRVDGLADNPTVSLFSEPAMDQASNLAYLLNGSAGIDEGSRSSSAYAGILLGLGLSNSKSMTGSIGEAMGIKDLRISTTGQGDNTKLAVTGQIADNLTLRYGVGVFSTKDGNTQEVALRYQLMPKLYLEAVRGLHHAVDLYYQFSLGEREETQD